MARLTKRAEIILQMAKAIAQEEGQGFVGTEHLLLAIFREEDGLGAQVLAEKGVDEDRIRAETARINAQRMQQTWVMGRLPGTPHYRDVLAAAEEQARGTGNWQICSIHLLLALLAEADCTGSRVLRSLGLTLGEVRRGLVQRLTHSEK